MSDAAALSSPDPAEAEAAEMEPSGAPLADDAGAPGAFRAPAEPASEASPGGFALSRMHVEVTGPEGAPPLLVLHGWGSSAWMMRPVAAALNDRFRVHTLDLPGHGRTAPPSVAWGVEEYAALVAAYMDANGLGATGMGASGMDATSAPVPAIGHSNGGRILLTMAADPAMASRFASLVLVSPSGIRRTPTARVRLKRAVARLLRAPFDVLPDGDVKDAALDWLRHTLVWKALGSSDYNRLPPTMRETFVRTVGHFVEDRLGRIRIPVLVFWGDRDTDIVREQMDRLVGGLPDAGLVVLEGAGHYGYLDRMDVFEAATRQFLIGPETVDDDAADDGTAEGDAADGDVVTDAGAGSAMPGGDVQGA